MNSHYLAMKPINDDFELPHPKKNLKYMLYIHVPFCERLCPYCSFNRFPYKKTRAVAYFKALRKEIRMLADAGYDFESAYFGGGTPTINLDELVKTINLIKRIFSVKEISCETNPNHLGDAYLDALNGKVDRLSVGVQSFDDRLLKQMDRYDKYGNAQSIACALEYASKAKVFKSLNADFIFNFPAQSLTSLKHDLNIIQEININQATFYPLMASPVVEKSLKATVGMVDYNRERKFYETICHELCDKRGAKFTYGSAWTFNANSGNMIDEYIVDYEQYPAVGSGSMSYLDNKLFVNTFSINEYIEKIDRGELSISSYVKFKKHDQMRYRFMMQLFGLKLDKVQWYADFKCTPASGLPAEYAFMKQNGAFENEDDNYITLSNRGRYLLVVMMRQFFIGVNSVRDKGRMSLPSSEQELLFKDGVTADKL
ncbi:MAG: coproporphyrinogen III oxidase family protein [Coriobacteriales bacterium]|nr:coproporphyrinogen III oxidase family protein [Coriobacteriales bacterium]